MRPSLDLAYKHLMSFAEQHRTFRKLGYLVNASVCFFSDVADVQPTLLSFLSLAVMLPLISTLWLKS